MLIKSENLITYKIDDGFMIYNKLYGKLLFIDETQHRIMQFFYELKELDDLVASMNLYDQREILEDIIKDFLEYRILLEGNFNERLHLKEENKSFINQTNDASSIDFIGFSITDKCNFSCKYCIASHQYQKYNKPKFDSDKLIKFIDWFIVQAITYNKSEVGIGFTGGEPLIEWNMIKSVLQFIFDKHRSSIKINVFINTNASLLTEEICADFKNFNIQPSLSLDGYKMVNDTVRVYNNGEGTFDDILGGMRLLKKAGINIYGFYLTLTDDNFNVDEKKLFDFCEVNGFNNITIEPDLVKPLSKSTDEVVEKLMKFYFVGKKRNVQVNGFWKRPYNNLTSYQDVRKGFCRALDFKSIVVNQNGDISPCGYSNTVLSNISNPECFNTEYKKFILSNLPGEILNCNNCEIEGACKGGCFITREQNDSELFEYRCRIYKGVTKELITSRENF
ncbi:hypothetical protein BK011_07830 [Tenericutes bacterium MZ-XQ]|nr:hypothetical protein BK011_07830 [Tenericutes bacterium MZ-XQ]